MNMSRVFAILDEISILVRAEKFQSPICNDVTQKSIRLFPVITYQRLHHPPGLRRHNSAAWKLNREFSNHIAWPEARSHTA